MPFGELEERNDITNILLSLFEDWTTSSGELGAAALQRTVLKSTCHWEASTAQGVLYTQRREADRLMQEYVTVPSGTCTLQAGYERKQDTPRIDLVRGFSYTITVQDAILDAYASMRRSVYETPGAFAEDVADLASLIERS
jgi:hypothetical protein